jgi:hypothetical protein
MLAEAGESAPIYQELRHLHQGLKNLEKAIQEVADDLAERIAPVLH